LSSSARNCRSTPYPLAKMSGRSIHRDNKEKARHQEKVRQEKGSARTRDRAHAHPRSATLSARLSTSRIRQTRQRHQAPTVDMASTCRQGRNELGNRGTKAPAARRVLLAHVPKARSGAPCAMDG